MKRKIALLCGGYSGEAEVSVNSASFVEKNIDRNRFDVYLIHVFPEGWYCEDEQGERFYIDKNDFSLVLPGGKVRFDLAFIMIHGAPGENGQLQGYFEMLNIPFTSCDSLTSGLTMNKAYTKAVLYDIEDMYMAQSVQLFEWDIEGAAENVLEKMRLPVFVKPNAGGSSIGMSKVSSAAALKDAIDLAFNTANTGRQVLVEEFVTGREFSVGVYRFQNDVEVLPATEVITGRNFFDYEAKYIPGLTQEITPAEINEGQVTRMEKIVKEIYKRLNCKGLVRIDFFLEDDTDRFYFIEINTIPGQTQTSFIPQQIRAIGKTESEFYGEWIEASLI